MWYFKNLDISNILNLLNLQRIKQFFDVKIYIYYFKILRNIKHQILYSFRCDFIGTNFRLIWCLWSPFHSFFELIPPSLLLHFPRFKIFSFIKLRLLLKIIIKIFCTNTILLAPEECTLIFSSISFIECSTPKVLTINPFSLVFPSIYVIHYTISRKLIIFPTSLSLSKPWVI